MAEAGYFKVFGNESAYRPVWALLQPSSLSAITSLKAMMLLPSLLILIPPKTWFLVFVTSLGPGRNLLSSFAFISM